MKRITTFSLIFITTLVVLFSPILQSVSVSAQYYGFTPEESKQIREGTLGDDLKPAREIDFSGSCDVWDIPCHLAKLSNALFVNLGKGVLFIAVGLFNASVEASVVEMDKHISESGVSAGWGIFLSIANIALIFILMFIGIATILKVQSYGYKQLLSKLLIIALLINFSFFFATFVIDASNNLSVDIINALSGDTSIPDRFAQAVQLQTTDATGGSASSGAIFLVGIFGLLFLLVTSFIFFAAAVLLLIRLVVLAFVIMLGPLALIAMILPVTSMYATQWWRALFSNSFFAPLYLLLVLVSLKILEAAPTPTGGIGEIVGSGGQRGVGVVVTFIIATGMMVASLVIAKKLGAVGAGGLIKTGQNWRKVTQGFLGRNTLGVLARSMARSDTMKQITRAIPPVGRALYGALDYGASAGFGSGRGAEQAAQARMDNIKKTQDRLKEVRPEDRIRLESEVVLPSEKGTEAEERKNAAYQKRQTEAEDKGKARATAYREGLGSGLAGIYSAREARGRLESSRYEEGQRTQDAKDGLRASVERLRDNLQAGGISLDETRILKNMVEAVLAGNETMSTLLETQQRFVDRAQGNIRDRRAENLAERQVLEKDPRPEETKKGAWVALHADELKLEAEESAIKNSARSSSGYMRELRSAGYVSSAVRSLDTAPADQQKAGESIQSAATEDSSEPE